MINDELLSKFDRIEDLPISEEMLGAYLEGNSDLFEESTINSLIQTNEYISELTNSIIFEQRNYLSNLDPNSFDVNNIELPFWYVNDVDLTKSHEKTISNDQIFPILNPIVESEMDEIIDCQETMNTFCSQVDSVDFSVNTIDSEFPTIDEDGFITQNQ